MARTPSTMVPLGTKAPTFNLIEPLTNNFRSFDELKGHQATVITFICNHCPFVIHIIKSLSEVGRRYMNKDISFIAINSNDIKQYPDDAPNFMKEFIHQYEITFPYLFDETQEVAKNYKAACTPDFFVFNKDKLLIYRGQFDESRPGNNIKVTGESLTNFLDAYLNKENTNHFAQKPSLGCNIKWLPSAGETSD